PQVPRLRRDERSDGVVLRAVRGRVGRVSAPVILSEDSVVILSEDSVVILSEDSVVILSEDSVVILSEAKDLAPARDPSVAALPQDDNALASSGRKRRIVLQPEILRSLRSLRMTMHCRHPERSEGSCSSPRSFGRCAPSG